MMKCCIDVIVSRRGVGISWNGVKFVYRWKSSSEKKKIIIHHGDELLVKKSQLSRWVLYRVD